MNMDFLILLIQTSTPNTPKVHKVSSYKCRTQVLINSYGPTCIFKIVSTILSNIPMS